MKEAVAFPDLDLDELDALHKLAGVEQDLGTRLDRVSERLLGRPYVVNPLGGGPGLPETLTVSLDGFDCVTYIETVLAIAASQTVGGFLNALRDLRYAQGEVDWFSRNHYMTDWVKNNAARGVVVNITEGPEAIEKNRTLGLIKDLPQKRVSFYYYPKPSLARARGRFASGDLILFVSARRLLDVFHAGFLFRTGDDILLRHAARSKGFVVEQMLTEFVADHRMSGFVILRPSGII